MQPKLGSFCWLELATTDRNAATRFYSDLFGWTAEESPMGPDFIYTMLKSGPNDVGGAYTLMKDQVEAGVPPHWMLYIKVESADDAAARAAELGARLIVKPTDIPNVGRFATVSDPTGATISVFQPGNHTGMSAFGEVGALCWADLNTPDAETASKFYADWLGWTYEAGDNQYRHIVNGTDKHDMIGGIVPGMHAPAGTPAHWLPYFHVTDCKASGKQARDLGASTIMAAELMPDVGTIAVVRDPQGAVFSLYQPL